MNIIIVTKLNIIKGYVNNDCQITKKTSIFQHKLLDLVNLVFQLHQ